MGHPSGGWRGAARGFIALALGAGCSGGLLACAGDTPATPFTPAPEATGPGPSDARETAGPGVPEVRANDTWRGPFADGGPWSGVGTEGIRPLWRMDVSPGEFRSRPADMDVWERYGEMWDRIRAGDRSTILADLEWLWDATLDPRSDAWTRSFRDRTIASIAVLAPNDAATRRHFEAVLEALERYVRDHRLPRPGAFKPLKFPPSRDLRSTWDDWLALSEALGESSRLVILAEDWSADFGDARTFPFLVRRDLFEALVGNGLAAEAGRLGPEIGDPDIDRVMRAWMHRDPAVAGSLGSDRRARDLEHVRFHCAQMHACLLAAGRDAEAETLAQALLAYDDSGATRAQLAEQALALGVVRAGLRDGLREAVRDGWHDDGTLVAVETLLVLEDPKRGAPAGSGRAAGR